MSIILTAAELAGVYAKLERADENIRNLNTELSAFLQADSAGGRTKDEYNPLDKWEEWIKTHAEREIPPRFSVLSGEIAHNLRSSLDHVAWLLSSESYRQSNERDIAFPILTVRPTTKSELTSYNAKIQGITSGDGRTLIEKVQPYNAGNPLDNPLAIVHELNRVDKHHAIVLVVATFEMGMKFPLSMFNTQIVCGVSTLNMSEEEFVEKFQHQIEVKTTRQIAFPEFGKRKNQPVIPSLTQLADAVREVINLFGS